jgi:hypothetical protein
MAMALCSEHKDNAGMGGVLLIKQPEHERITAFNVNSHQTLIDC